MNLEISKINANRLEEVIAGRSAVVGVIGLGYIGYPLAVTIACAGFPTIGFDIDPAKLARISQVHFRIEGIPDDKLQELVQSKRLVAAAEFSELEHCDVIIVCVPTPLTMQRAPDLSAIEAATHAIARHLRPAQLVVLESTSYPGTTVEIAKPILENSGLVSGAEFFLGFSPHREDLGNSQFHISAIPRIVAGDGPDAQRLMEKFHQSIVRAVIPVSSPTVAEAVKMTENVFRAVNIALINELKIFHQTLGVNIWEVIDAASTKPFGFMPFYPGPGVGGHCIAVDPIYLVWKSKKDLGYPLRLVELANEINSEMPRYVVERLTMALAQRFSLPLDLAKILIVGIAYKKNVNDVRESAALHIMRLLRQRGAMVEYHDPHVPSVPWLDESVEFAGWKSADLCKHEIGAFDAIVLATDHDALDYSALAAQARLIVDTRNVFARRRIGGKHIIGA